MSTTSNDINRNAKIADIFLCASNAFSKLSELTLELNKQEDSKWTNDDIKQLKDAVFNFGQNIENISETINDRSKQQIKELIKKNIQQQQQQQQQNQEQEQKETINNIENNLK